MTQPTDFLNDYRMLAQQSWDAWMRQLGQHAAPASSPFAPFASFMPQPPSPAQDFLSRSSAGIKGFMDWMQNAMAQSSNATPDWPQQLQRMFGEASQPFVRAFDGLDQSGAHGFGQQWQHWLQAMQQGGAANLRAPAPMAPLGYSREQQLGQQAMATAIAAYMETTGRYQTLIQRANAQGLERMQQLLAQRGEQDSPVESMKALYDLWVDASEQAYAEIALSDEFRDAYGAMVNAQMQVRKLQREETEKFCRELGIPTGSEVASLGERLQALRREVAELRRQRDDFTKATPGEGAPSAKVVPTPATAPRKRKAPARRAAASSTTRTATKKSASTRTRKRR